MRYHDPLTVRSPKEFVDNVVVLFNGGVSPNHPFAIAKITWEGTECIGIRWNVNQREWDDPEKISGQVICIGEPQSRGYPTWFILPKYFLDKLLSGQSGISEALIEALKNMK